MYIPALQQLCLWELALHTLRHVCNNTHPRVLTARNLLDKRLETIQMPITENWLDKCGHLQGHLCKGPLFIRPFKHMRQPSAYNKDYPP